MIDEESERKKYTKMWNSPGYRLRSPGEALVPRFLNQVAWHPGDTLIDLGCGAGLAALKLQEAGLEVTMLDLCLEGPTPKALNTIPFLIENLWALPPQPIYDWIFCCDVLEHLPTEHVDEALDHMAHITGKGGFLQIAMFPDADRPEGEVLHLTVRPSEWWLEKLEKRWDVHEFEIDSQRLIVVLGLLSEGD